MILSWSCHLWVKVAYFLWICVLLSFLICVFDAMYFALNTALAAPLKFDKLFFIFIQLKLFFYSKFFFDPWLFRSILFHLQVCGRYFRNLSIIYFKFNYSLVGECTFYDFSFLKKLLTFDLYVGIYYFLHIFFT